MSSTRTSTQTTTVTSTLTTTAYITNFQCQEYEGVSILHADAAVIDQNLREIRDVLDHCSLDYSEVGKQTIQVDSDGTTVQAVRDSTILCETTIASLNEMINKFTMGEHSGEFFCSLSGEFIAETNTCLNDAKLLNAAIFASQTFAFNDCDRTTGTTSGTSTLTSTATTSGTTTPPSGKFSCFTYAKQNYLEVNGDATVCNQQVGLVDEVLTACEATLHGTTRDDDSFTCSEVSGVQILYDSSTGCPDSANALMEVLDKYKERDYGTITCSTVLGFEQKFTLEEAIGSHACSLEASKRVTNSIPLGSPLSYRLAL
jgi:hypothetical protein